MVRRHGAGSLVAEHLAALDLADGSLRWVRHIAATVVHDRSLNRPPLGGMLVADGLVYVADHLGSVACVEISGRMRWLYAFSTLARDLADGRALGLSGSAPWRVSDPVMLPDGLLAPLPAPSSGAILLDRYEGHKIRDMTGPLWAQPLLVTAIDDDVLLAGASVTRLDGRSFAPLWQTALPEPAAGRPAIAAHGVVVPLARRTLVLDARDGQVRATLSSDEPANAVTVGGGLVLAAAERLYGHLPWLAAQTHLRRQITAAGDDAAAAGAALSLAYLAARQQRDAVLLEAADAALDAARRAERTDVDQVVFEQLLPSARGLAPRWRPRCSIGPSRSGPAATAGGPRPRRCRRARRAGRGRSSGMPGSRRRGRPPGSRRCRPAAAGWPGSADGSTC
jgi:hypothetical protein